jgi:hypothetical protein
MLFIAVGMMVERALWQQKLLGSFGMLNAAVRVLIWTSGEFNPKFENKIRGLIRSLNDVE